MRLETVPDIRRELDRLRRDLVAQFRGERWADLSRTLDSLAEFGEANGSLEICLRAQTLRQRVGGSSPAAEGRALAPHVDELVHRLTHLRWASARLAG